MKIIIQDKSSIGDRLIFSPSLDKALLFDIQSASVHDGPGQRTTFFFSGCPLHCPWCSNPEGAKKEKRVIYSSSRCKLCARCIQNCPHDAISFHPNDSKEKKVELLIERSQCHEDLCHFSCVNQCYQEALSISGFEFSLLDFENIIKRDRPFWGRDGGITFSGGEPLLWEKFIEKALNYCHDHYVHTAIETTAYAPWEIFSNLLRKIDFIFIDLKHMDSIIHQKWTGVPNELILANIAKFVKEQKSEEQRLVIRMPLIPGFNDDEKNLKATATWMNENHLSEINILPMHNYASTKYLNLGLPDPYKEMVPVSQQNLLQNQHHNLALAIFEGKGIQLYWGAETPF